MKDFFDEPAAIVEHDESQCHNILVSALARKNGIDSKNEDTLGEYRLLGEEFIRVRDLRGRGNWKAYIAKVMKMSERQIERIIALAESPDTLPVEEQMAILWGHPVKPKEGRGKGIGTQPVTEFNRSKLIGGFNRFTTHTKAFAEKHGMTDDKAVVAILKLAETALNKFKELEKKAEAK